MNINEFIKITNDDIYSFKRFWEKNNNITPNDYPLELSSIADWFEQFLMYLETEV